MPSESVPKHCFEQSPYFPTWTVAKDPVVRPDHAVIEMKPPVPPFHSVKASPFAWHLLAKQAARVGSESMVDENALSCRVGALLRRHIVLRDNLESPVSQLTEQMQLRERVLDRRRACLHRNVLRLLLHAQQPLKAYGIHSLDIYFHIVRDPKLENDILDCNRLDLHR